MERVVFGGERLVHPPPVNGRRRTRPVLVEFAGTPRAGKTTALRGLEELLSRVGYRVEVVTEGASRCPLRDKLNPAFNVWTGCFALSRLLEKLDSDAQIVLIDRGMFDALCWMDWFHTSGMLAADEHEAIQRFFRLDRWRALIDIVFVMTVEPTEALEREFGRQLAQRRGSIMNSETLHDFNRSIGHVKMRHESEFRCIAVDTTRLDADSTLGRISREVLNRLQKRPYSRPPEFVLTVPRWAIAELPILSRFVSEEPVVRQFLDALRHHGEYVDRQDAEDNPELIRPIPVAYVRHRGQLLVVPHERRYSVCLGGPVERADARDGDPLASGLRRELEAELGCTELPMPRLVGIVADEPGDHRGGRVGVVHEIELDDPALADALGHARAAHASGWARNELRCLTDLAVRFDQMEPWSQLILTELLQLNDETGPSPTGPGVSASAAERMSRA